MSVSAFSLVQTKTSQCPLFVTAVWLCWELESLCSVTVQGSTACEAWIMLVGLGRKTSWNPAENIAPRCLPGSPQYFLVSSAQLMHTALSLTEKVIWFSGLISFVHFFFLLNAGRNFGLGCRSAPGSWSVQCPHHGGQPTVRGNSLQHLI